MDGMWIDIDDHHKKQYEVMWRIVRGAKNLINKYEEQDKIIELMAEELSEEDENFLYRSTGDIIEYFEKKARGENK